MHFWLDKMSSDAVTNHVVTSGYEHSSFRVTEMFFNKDVVMLVLSRKEDQKIIFPNLGISLEIIRVKGNSVRVGIDAPKSVRIMRGELLDRDEEAGATAVLESLEKNLSSLDAETRHTLRNYLNEANLAVNVAQKKIATGGIEDSEKFLSRAVVALNELNLLFEELSLPGHCQTSESEFASPEDAGFCEGRRQWTALIVEDNDNERELMSGVLEMAGFEVIGVPDGQAAIEFLESNNKPDIVLMDMQMPRLNGPQTVSKIRNELHDQNLPIFAVSGLSQEEAKLPVGERGVTGWFSKPVNPNRLVKYLQQEMETRIPTALN